MERYLPSNEEILKKFKTENQIIERGKELREEGYKLHHHMIYGHSVEIPSGEVLNRTQMTVRYADAPNKEEFEKASEYLILCGEKLVKINNLEFNLS